VETLNVVYDVTDVSESSRKLIKILIVDHQTIVRHGLRALIEKQPGMAIVGETGSCTEALSLAQRHQPDIILLEVDAGDRQCLGLISDFRKAAHTARVVVLTGSSDLALHRRAVLLGAMGLVGKEQSLEILLRAIEKVYGGEAWLDHTMTASVIAEFSRPSLLDDEKSKIASLTQREREIISIACQGLKNSKIADRLFISEKTVRNHFTSILSKLGLSDRLELALYCYHHGLAKPPAFHSGEKSA
jgi:two-component system, NarL family, nitrate/nitrite response regulator NarL